MRHRFKGYEKHDLLASYAVSDKIDLLYNHNESKISMIILFSAENWKINWAGRYAMTVLMKEIKTLSN